MNHRHSDNKPGVFMVCGSVRQGSMTRSTMDILESTIKKRGFDTEIFHPENMPVRALGAPFEKQVQQNLQSRMLKARGIVFCTPEYNGCFSSVMMAILENLGHPSVLRSKPVSLLGVASGEIGAVKALEHLRGVCSHMGAVVLPCSISIAEVHKKFDHNRQLINNNTRELIEKLADELICYISARGW